MERISSNASWKDIRTLFRAGSLCGLTDRQLLDRFVSGDREEDRADAEAAFEVLVKRHGPMVQRLCRSLLNNRHDSDDAFQATFLVLARRGLDSRPRGGRELALRGRRSCCGAVAHRSEASPLAGARGGRAIPPGCDAEPE